MQIVVSEPAAEALKQVIQEHGTLGSPATVRIGVQGACGCGTAHFGMALDDKQEGDTIVEVNGINFLVDSESVPYLEGAELDYSDDLVGRGFRINAVKSGTGGGCGCGGGHGHSH
jgi:iron-sulfur cluster assembly accessory protein